MLQSNDIGLFRHFLYILSLAGRPIFVRIHTKLCKTFLFIKTNAKLYEVVPWHSTPKWGTAEIHAGAEWNMALEKRNVRISSAWDRRTNAWDKGLENSKRTFIS